MSNLQIKGIDSGLYAELKCLAAAERRSVSQQVIFLAKEYLARNRSARSAKTPAEVLLALSGSWSDDKSADEIIKELKQARRNSKRVRAGL